MSSSLVIRPIQPEDIEGLAELVAEAMRGYRAFAPPDWRSPPAATQAAALRRWLNAPGAWGELALADDGILAGHATFIPAARHSFRAVDDPSLAHLGHLFLRQPHWGSGLAGELLARARSNASERGYETMRLFVPEAHARARRFYAREGFDPAGEPFDPGLGLPVLEYRHSLRRRDTRTPT